jgi:hypothetical protein
MKVVWLLALLVLSLSSAVAQDCRSLFGVEYNRCTRQQERAMMGKYLCIVDRVAGIQYKEGDGVGTPFVGQIRLPTDRFFLELSEDNTMSCGLFANVFPENDPELFARCKSRFKMTAKLDALFAPDGIGYSAGHPTYYNTSRGFFSIAQNGAFSGYYHLYNSYAYEGRCEKIAGQ